MKAVDAISFTGLVAYGRDHGGNMVNGMPWSFYYQGHPVSHENDGCYLVSKRDGKTLRVTSADILVTLENGELVIARPVEP